MLEKSPVIIRNDGGSSRKLFPTLKINCENIVMPQWRVFMVAVEVRDELDVVLGVARVDRVHF